MNEAWLYFRQHGIKKSLTAKDAPWMIQFAKYGFCGVAAVVAHNLAVYWLNYNYLPFRGDVAEALSDTEKSNNLMIANLIAFPIGNFVAYFSNLIIVFEGGRHSRWKEFVYFTVISFISWFVGLMGGPVLVRYGLNPDFAQLGFVITSALVNFVCRKFIIFKN